MGWRWRSVCHTEPVPGCFSPEPGPGWVGGKGMLISLAGGSHGDGDSDDFPAAGTGWRGGNAAVPRVVPGRGPGGWAGVREPVRKAQRRRRRRRGSLQIRLLLFPEVSLPCLFPAPQE